MKDVYVMTMTEDPEYVKVFANLNGVVKELNELGNDYCAWPIKTDDELKAYILDRIAKHCVYLLIDIEEGTPFAEELLDARGLELRYLPIE